MESPCTFTALVALGRFEDPPVAIQEIMGLLADLLRRGGRQASAAASLAAHSASSAKVPALPLVQQHADPFSF